MVQLSQNASRLLNCHRSIEVFCAEKADELLKYLDVLFNDLMDDDLMNAVKDDPTRTLFGLFLNSSTENLELALDKSDALLHFSRMQLDVLSRATQRKEQELYSIEQKLLFLPRSAARAAETPLPTLPSELLMQIFSRLYWAETTRDFENTTLNKLIEDGGTVDCWKHFIRRCIPVAIVTSRAFSTGMLSRRENHRIVGPHPRVIGISELGEDSADILKNKSTVVFTTLLDFEEMEEIRQLPWHNLVMSTETVPAASHVKLMRSFVESFGAKLAEIDHVDIRPFFESIYDPSLTDSTQPIGGHQNLESKLRKSRLPLTLLLVPIFLPFLRNIADLDVVFSTRDLVVPSATALLALLAPYSNTLINLKISCPEDLRRIAYPTSGSPINASSTMFSFPSLKQMVFSSFTGCYTKEILVKMDSPLLRHLSLAFRDHRCRCSDRIGSHCMTAVTLHHSFPMLEFISLQSPEKLLTVNFFGELTVEHEISGWLLPKLNSTEISAEIFREETAGHYKSSLLALSKLVSSRLRADPSAASAIHSVHILRNGYSRDMSSHIMNTFRLLVPDLVIRRI